MLVNSKSQLLPVRCPKYAVRGDEWRFTGFRDNDKDSIWN